MGLWEAMNVQLYRYVEVHKDPNRGQRVDYDGDERHERGTKWRSPRCRSQQKVTVITYTSSIQALPPGIEVQPRAWHLVVVSFLAMSDTLTTPIKTTASRSRSGTTSSTLLVSPSLLRLASSSSTSTVRLTRDHAGQSGLRDEEQLDEQTMLGVAGPSSSRTPSLVQRTSEGSISRSASRSRGRLSSPGSGVRRSLNSSPTPSGESLPTAAEQSGARTPGLQDARIGLKRLISKEIQPSSLSAVSPASIGKGKGRETQGEYSKVDIGASVHRGFCCRCSEWLLSSPVLHPHQRWKTGVRLVSRAELFTYSEGT